MRGGYQPPKLTPEVAKQICADIQSGCYLTVAAARSGVIPYTIYLWNQRGMREALGRAEAQAQGLPTDGPMSRYEEFFLMLESAKAEARYSAETRVFQTNPLAWLKSGYARRDWQGSDVAVRVTGDDVAKQAADLMGVSDTSLSPTASSAGVYQAIKRRAIPYTNPTEQEQETDTDDDND